MSNDSTAEKVCESVVFEDVTVDPDAVLAAFGTDSPEEIVASAEADEGTDDDPERSADEELETIDVVAEELFGDLPAGPADTGAGSAAADETGASDRAEAGAAESANGGEAAPEIVVCRPTVVVDEGGADFIESLFGEREAAPAAADDDDLRLVGSGPKRTRVGNDAFGSTVRPGASVGRVGGTPRVERA